MNSSHRGLRRALCLLVSVCVLNATASAATLNFTLQMSEPVLVTGTPRIALDVGGVTRYAGYTAGSGTNSLTFSYAVQARDFDANGISVASSLDPNGGSLQDNLGNAATNLNFTAPDTSGIKIQTYRTTFTTVPITSANATAVGFTITKAPQGGSYSYTISSSGGAGSVTGSGTINSNSESITGVDVSSLPPGTLTLSVTISVSGQGTGAARQDTALLDNLPPTGYTTSFISSYVNLANHTSAGIQIAGGENDAGFSYTISSSGGGTPVSGTGTISTDPQQITGLDLSGLADGTLTVSTALTDTLNNAGSAVTATVTKDTVAPTIVSVTPPPDGTYDDL